jgi:hypothetical protein
MRHLRSRALIVAVAAMVSSGCFGSFQAVRNVYSWNKSFGDGNKWAQELMYIVIGGIVPVYGVAGMLDALVLNSIEFWTGKNPMTATTKVTEKDGTKVTQTMRSDMGGRTEVVEVSTPAGVQSTTTMFQATGSQTVTSTTRYVDGRSETKAYTVDESGKLTPQH